MAKNGEQITVGDEPDILTGSNAPRETDRTLERALGQQVRHLRRQHDLSIADLAATAGISTGMAAGCATSLSA